MKINNLQKLLKRSFTGTFTLGIYKFHFTLSRRNERFFEPEKTEINNQLFMYYRHV